MVKGHSRYQQYFQSKQRVLKIKQQEKNMADQNEQLQREHNQDDIQQEQGNNIIDQRQQLQREHNQNGIQQEQGNIIVDQMEQYNESDISQEISQQPIQSVITDIKDQISKAIDQNQRINTTTLINELQNRFIREKQNLCFPNEGQITQLIKQLWTNHENYTQRLIILEKLLKNVQIIDLNLMKQLLDNANKAEVTIQQKNVILIIGNTGSGKTTTILKLLGNKFKLKEDGKQWVLDSNCKPEYQSFRTSNRTVSETSTINAALIPKQMTKNIVYDQQIYLCDTPGLGQTKGVQYDIANQQGTWSAIKGCNSLRLVLLIPNSDFLKSNAKMASIRSTATDFCTIFPTHTHENNKQSYRILINQIQSEPKHDTVLQNMKQLVNEPSNSSITTQEKQFLEKLEDQSACAYNFINPVKCSMDDSKKILKRLVKLKPIRNISQIFSYTISEKSKITIAQFKHANERNCRKMIELGKYSRAKYYYDRKKELIKLLYENGKDQLKEQQSVIIKERNSAVTEFQNQLLKIVMNDDEKSYERAKDCLKRLQYLSSSFKEIIPQTQLQNKIDQLIDRSGDRIKKQFQEKEDIDINFVQKITNKIVQFAQHFNRPNIIKDLIQEKKQLYNQRIDFMQSAITNGLSDIDPQELRQIQLLQHILRDLQQVNDSPQLNKVAKLRKSAAKKIEQLLNSTSNIVQQPMSENNAKTINAQCTQVKNLLNSGLSDKLTEDRDNTHLNNIKQTILDKSKKKIGSLMNNYKEASMQNILQNNTGRTSRELVRQIKLFMLIDFVKQQQGYQYDSTINTIQKQLKLIQLQQIQEKIEEADDQNQLDIQKLSKDLKKFQSFSDIIGKDNTDQIIQDIFKPLLGYYNRTFLSEGSFSVIMITSTSALTKTQGIIQKKWNKLLAHQSILKLDKSPEIQQILNNFKRQIDHKISQPLKQFNDAIKSKLLKVGVDNQQNSVQQRAINRITQILQFFRRKLNDIEYLQKYISFVTNLKKFSPFQSEFTKDLKEMKQLIKKTFVETGEQLIGTFKKSSLKQGISEDFVQLTQLLNLIQNKQQLDALFLQLSFKPSEKIDQINNKMKQKERQIGKQIDRNQNRITELFDICQYIYKLEKIENNIQDKKARINKYHELITKIEKSIEDEAKSNLNKVQNVFNSDYNTKKLFDKLQFILCSDKEHNREDKNLRRQIQENLSIRVTKLFDNIYSYEQKDEQSYSNDNQSSQEDELPKYVDDCHSLFVVNNKLSQEFWKKSAKAIICFDKISEKQLKRRQLKLRSILKKEIKKAIDSFERLSMKEYEFHNRIIEKIEKCLLAVPKSQNEQQRQIQGVTKQQINKYKKDILEISKKMVENTTEQMKSLKIDVREESIRQIFKLSMKYIMDFIQKTYKNKQKLIIDDRFATYYNSCSSKDKQQLKKTIQSSLSSKFQKYQQNGDIFDKQIISLKQQIQKLPYELREEWHQKIHDKEAQLEKEMKDKHESFLEKCRSQPSLIIQHLKTMSKLSSSAKTVFHQHLNVLDQALALMLIFFNHSTTSGIYGLQKYYQDQKSKFESQQQVLKQYRKAQSAWQLFRQEQARNKIKQLFQKHYKQIIEKLHLKIKPLSSTLQSIMKGKSDQDSIKNEIQRIIPQLFMIFKTIEKDQDKLFCSDTATFKNIKKEWSDHIEIIIKVAKVSIEPKKQYLSLSQQDMKDYLICFTTSAGVMESINKHFGQLIRYEREIYNSEMVTILKNKMKQLQPEIMKQKIGQQVQAQIKYISEYELLKRGRHNDTEKKLIEQFTQLYKKAMELEDKLNIINKHFVNCGNGASLVQTMLNSFKNSFNRLTELSVGEVNANFRSTNNKTVTNVNMFFKITTSLSEIFFFQIIPPQLVKKERNKMDKLITKRFQTLGQQINKQSEQLSIGLKRLHLNHEKRVQKQRRDLRGKQCEKNQQIERITQILEAQKIDKIKKQQNVKEKDRFIKQYNTQINSQKNLINANYQLEIKNIRDNFENESKHINEQTQKQFEKFAEKLILYQKNIVQITQVRQQSKQFLKKKFNEFINEEQSFRTHLAQSLKRQDSKGFGNFGNYILQNYRIFASYQDQRRQKLTEKQDINYVLENLKTNDKTMEVEDKKKLKKSFECYQQQYITSINTFKKYPTSQTKTQIKNRIMNLAQQLKHEYLHGIISTKRKQKFLAMILALYAITKADTVNITFRPHEIQVVTLLLLLGIANDNNQALKNRMAQVGTGQGKSFILASMSAYLALVGFQVKCACYSQILSSRDAHGFKQFYEYLDISSKIKYGTFNQVCEEILNTNKSDFKTSVSRMVLSQPENFYEQAQKIVPLIFSSNHDKINSTPTVLLIDEADVFFNKEFFGQCYRPSIKLQGKNITNLLKSVWTKSQKKQLRKGDLVQNVRQSQQFKQVVKEYPNLEEILNNQLNNITAGAFGYEHKYEFRDQRLVYIENDTINQHLSYGFKTVFANLYQQQKKNISEINLDKALCIQLAVAQFSYSALPNFFKFIIGVTGTLQSMPTFKKEILKKEYNVNNNYLIPSSFGLHLKKKKSYIQVQEGKLFSEIIQRIKIVNPQRPILIFFKNDTVLNEFYNSKEYIQSFSSRTTVFNERHNPEDRQSLVKNATNPHQITLMTKDFGRGYDYKVYEDQINKNGGVHVIQTWISPQQSQEDQIGGRTNRQNTEGSFEIIYTVNQLQQFSETKRIIDRSLTSMNIALQKDRQKIAQSQRQDLEAQQKKSLKSHQQVKKIYSDAKLTQEKLLNYIMEINKCRTFSVQKVQTVIALDGTNSMYDKFKKVKEILQETFRRTYKIIEDQKAIINVEMKILIYRNYNSTANRLIQQTPFQNDCENILKFLNTVEVDGGWGNEAIQICLYQLNKMGSMDQVILIGDAGWNKKDEVETKRKSRGQQYWNENGYPHTNTEDELQNFVTKWQKSPIHTFYFKKAKLDFEKISARTKGKSQEWPKETPVQKLTNFISAQILSIADNKLSTQPRLIKAYEKLYH